MAAAAREAAARGCRGRGGRSQGLALAAVVRLAMFECPVMPDRRHRRPDPRRGAVVDTGTTSRAVARRPSRPGTTSRRTTSCRISIGVGDPIQAGPRGTNVGDLQVLVVASGRV
jgi:glycerate-2-kinase